MFVSMYVYGCVYMSVYECVCVYVYGCVCVCVHCDSGVIEDNTDLGGEARADNSALLGLTLRVSVVRRLRGEVNLHPAGHLLCVILGC